MQGHVDCLHQQASISDSRADCRYVGTGSHRHAAICRHCPNAVHQGPQDWLRALCRRAAQPRPCSSRKDHRPLVCRHQLHRRSPQPI